MPISCFADIFYFLFKIQQVVDGTFSDLYDRVYIFDCRFDYEYGGGHIKRAQHLPVPGQLDSIFFENPIQNETVLIIFYCEFSSQRGPAAYRYMRAQDRRHNSASYPRLYYPHLYLIEGGYCRTFAECKSVCDPQNYIEMKNKEYEQELKQNFKNLRKARPFQRTRSYLK